MAELRIDNIAPMSDADQFITMLHVLQGYPRCAKTSVAAVAKGVCSILKRTDKRFIFYSDSEM